MAWRLALTVTFGCGRIAFSRELPGDASPDVCDPTAPFGEPQPIVELNDAAEQEGTLRLFPDELRGYYWSRRASNSHIRYVHRTAIGEPFEIEDVALASTGVHQVDPTFTSDGSMLVYRESGPGDQLYYAIRISEVSFDTPVAISTLNTAATETQCFFANDGELYFSSGRSGGDDLYRSTRTGTTFSAPELVNQLASPAAEGDPAIAPDQLSIYFRSQRAPSQAFDIWVAKRDTPTAAWGTPELVPNINSAVDDGPSWVSVDGCRLYMSSERAGTNDVYVATRGR